MGSFENIVYIYIYIFRKTPSFIRIYDKIISSEKINFDNRDIHNNISSIYVPYDSIYLYFSFFFYLRIIPSIKLRIKIRKIKYLKLVSLMSAFNFNLFMILVV